MEEKLHILFVCGKNQWRSPTAEAIYKNDQRFYVKSAGLSKVAKRRISERDLLWADLIFVMEQEQRRRLRQSIEGLEGRPEIVCLDIADIYQYMDEELIRLLREGVESELEEWEI